MQRRRRLSLVGLLAVFTMVVGQGVLGTASARVLSYTPASHADKALFFTSDGMRPDLMQKYVNDGSMPTYAQLIANGVKGDNGLLPAFPPNTGVGWYTLMTGTWPSEHGSTNNTYFRTGDTFSNRTSFSGAGSLQADTLAASLERSGKSVAQIDWVGGTSSGIAGPTVDFATFYSNRGVVVPTSVPADAASAATFGVNYLPSPTAPATGWTNVPLGDPLSPPKEATFTIPNTTTNGTNFNRPYNLYFYDKKNDGVQKYDNVYMVPGSKDGALRDATLTVGTFQSIRLTGANGLIGTRAGESAGFHVKLIKMTNNLSDYKIYFTSIARGIATCSTAACDALPAGVAGENKLEKYIADNLPPWSAADFAAEEAGLIDELTYVQQGRELEIAYSDAVMNYILGTLQPNTDAAFVGYPFTDEVSHQFLGLIVKKDLDGDPNPYYDDADDNNVPDGLVSKRKGYIKSAYVEADKKLKKARKLLDEDNPKSVTTFASSDHGFAPQWYAINANKILFDTQVFNTSTATNESVHASSGTSTSNCSAATTDYAKACWAGGTTQIYINPTLPAGVTTAAVQTAILNAFNGLTDPANPGKQVLQRVMLKSELRDVQGDDSLFPNRSGDVVVVSRPPYQWDAPTAGLAFAPSHFFGQHGYLPETVNTGRDVNMHSVFVASGPGVVHSSTPVEGVRAIDLAPTLAYLLGVPGPIQARGKILYDITKGGSDVVEATLLTISDFHGQLIPITEVADPGLPASAAFGLGGAAFLKPWLDWYRNEARDGSITFTGGDAVGASPAISSYFGDVPTMDAFNMLGMDADTLGNHNFDRGQQYLRDTLIPEANFPYLSANVVDAGGNTPAEWSPSHTFDFGGEQLAVIGFELPDLTELVFPGNVDPFHVTDPATAINDEAADLEASGVHAIVAAGHMGMAGGTITAPDPGQSPVFGVADALTNVDAIVGGHTHTEYVTWRNGMSVTENQNATARFTRIRLVIDKATGDVVYETADYHRPWDIGVTPDPDIQAMIDDLNAQLGPILGTVIANSDKYVPRSDSCSINTGRIDGRGCESLVGDIVADAMRTTYSGIGANFAITNSGGLRADLTCPTVDVGGDTCPGYTPPPFPITKGSVLGVLPFGNLSTTTPLHGDGLKAMLENGVSLIGAASCPVGPCAPNASQGRFPQISGLCFTYDITQNVNNRVTSAVYANPDGSCGATPVDLTAGSPEYLVVQNDFMMTGGDGYPNVKSTSTTQNIMDQDVANYLQNHSQPISPTIQGRITCVQGGGPNAGNQCPVANP